MPLKNPQLFMAVHDAMAKLFQQDEQALEAFTVLRLHEHLANLAPPGILPTRIFQVVDRMDSHGEQELQRLALALFQHFPGRAELAPLASLLPALPAAPAAGAPAQPLRPTRLYGSQYVIDREDVWDRLQQMSGVPGQGGGAADQAGNVLLVTGQPKIGKSLVADLVASLASQRGDRHAEVKFRRIQFQPDPATLATMWLNRIHPTLPAADRVPLQIDATNFARQPLDAAMGVLRALAATNETWWLVFDGPDSVLDEKGRATRPQLSRALLDFFDMLCDDIAASYRHVRLVLIGLEDNQLSSKRAGVQEIADVCLPQLVALFEQICKARTPPAEPGVAEWLAEFVWSRVPAGSVGHVEKLHREITAALQKLAAPGGLS